MWFMVHPIFKMDQGVLFVDQSKTASTTMGEVFWHAIMISRGHIGSYHQTAKFLKFNYGKYWEAYHTFSVVRNPYDRFISAFYFKADKWINDGPFEREATQEELERLMEPYGNFALRPQVSYIADDSGKIIVDQLMLFENVKNETGKLVDKFKIPFVDINDFDRTFLQKTSHKKHWREYYEENPDLWHLVNNNYKEDIDLYLSLGGKIDGT